MAQALEAWHKAGAAAGDIAFWRQHVEAFTSPKAYALVVEALLDAGDLVAAMALLVQWLSQAGQLPLEQGEFSFHVAGPPLAGQGLRRRRSGQPRAAGARRPKRRRWCKNSSTFWKPTPTTFGWSPTWNARAARSARRKRAADDDEELPEEDRELFAAAYDEMVYVDSTADGVEADMLEGRIGRAEDRLRAGAGRPARCASGWPFSARVSQLWKTAALACGSPAAEKPLDDDVLGGWLSQANHNHDAAARPAGQHGRENGRADLGQPRRPAGV